VAISEHRIRLRGGWECHPASGDDEPTRRVTLPFVWPADASRTVRLVRPFNRPPIDPARESLVLELDQVEGLAALLLNDRELARPPRGTSRVVISLDGPLPARNELVLEVEPPAVGNPGSTWGMVALVIRPAGANGPDQGEPLGGQVHPV
jgi:hypothetical protein